MNMDELEPPQPAERPTRDSRPKLDAERWVEEYGDVLFGFAAARVRDHVIAQDLVQETFLAAIKASENFAGRSTERAWLFGILRNKLVDYYRRQSREIALADLETTLPEEEGAFGRSGLSKDGWEAGLGSLRSPGKHQDGTLVSKEFQEVFRGLPRHDCLIKVAQVFLLREVDAVSSEEICKRFGGVTEQPFGSCCIVPGWGCGGASKRIGLAANGKTHEALRHSQAFFESLTETDDYVELPRCDAPDIAINGCQITSGIRRLAIRVHLLYCVWCRRYASQLQFLRNATMELPPEALKGPYLWKLSVEDKERMRARLQDGLKNFPPSSE